MTGKNKDWIAIYPQGSNNDWDNVIGWQWTDDKASGDLTFGNGHLAVGNYEVRAFYNNSFHTEATKAFKVSNGGGGATTVTTNKTTYTDNENIVATYKGTTNGQKDWIAIYPKNSSNAWDNVIQWQWIKGKVNGTTTFTKLPAGEYEVRVFFNNTFQDRAKKSFKVTGNAGPDRILYFDAEHGGLNKWSQYLGDGVNQTPGKIINQGARGSAHSFRADKYTAFYFTFNKPAKKLKFLDFDVRIGMSSHVGNFGVYLKTKLGDRRMTFDTYLNHPGNDWSGLPPEKWTKPFPSQNGYMHNHPAPLDYYLVARNEHSSRFTHFKIDIEAKLKIIEPNNELLQIEGFSTSGGDFDNLALSAN